jgi:hypothetical protein
MCGGVCGGGVGGVGGVGGGSVGLRRSTHPALIPTERLRQRAPLSCLAKPSALPRV